MRLICLTKGNSAPQGKPRVYYTGHPLDLPVYSKDIFSDIFKSQNCVIYRDAEPEAPCEREELLQELEQMQLFVIPVTNRFLSQPSRARDVEFPFAMEKHIPVLPLMQEDGLESGFNEKCGDLQMLNKHDPDPTALPYEEKLEKFLASVLVGDELAKQVRAAFDAYVFLSYRKKDRKYAQKLMRLIHKNDFCRNIAIWYDEFLTPGENFNEAIADALKKCSLFTLAVTPNLVEPGNYVMRLEYPGARKAGKPILPVELVPTDKEVLQSTFEGIPPCADAGDEQGLSAALLEAVRKLAIRENDGDPQHNFFIGLAYLNGIDVEVDRERAVGIITSAAQAGLPEAMMKLVDMYRSGGGVERDYRAAIGWQEKLADLRRKTYEQSGTEEDGLEWWQSLGSLGDYQRELAELPAARKSYETIVILCEKLNAQYASNETRRACAVSYLLLGHVSRDEGKLTEAKEYYLQALKLFKQLFEETGTAAACSDLAASFSSLGDISRHEEKLSEAKGYYLCALELDKQLYEKTETAEARRGLSSDYTKLGGICQLEGNLTEAKSYYLQALELFKQLYEETGTVVALRSLSVAYGTLGDISEALGRLAEAKGYYLPALELSKQAYEEIGTVETQLVLSVIYYKLGGISKAEGDLAEAKGYYLPALELNRQLYKKIGTVKVRQNLTCIYSSLGDICRAEGKLAEARDHYLHSLELSKRLYEETGTVKARFNLAFNFSRLGRLSVEEENLTEAKNYYLQNLKLCKQLCGEDGVVEARQILSNTYEILGNISEEEGDAEQAQWYFSQAETIRRASNDGAETIQA